MEETLSIPIGTIPICCVCQQVRDDQQINEGPASNGTEKWMSLKSLLRRYHIPQGAYQLTHTYCGQCVKQLGLDRPQVGNGLGPARAETPQKEMERRILSAITTTSECDLDTIVSLCGDVSWNQVFLEVDRMSRLGIIRLTRSADRTYRVAVPESALAS